MVSDRNEKTFEFEFYGRRNDVFNNTCILCAIRICRPNGIIYLKTLLVISSVKVEFPSNLRCDWPF